MGDRTGFVWTDPPLNNRIDGLVAAKWKRLKILPSPLCSDTEFLRRVYLDLTGLPPSPEHVPRLHRRPARHAAETRRVGRSPADQRCLRRALDQQVGRPVPGQSQVSWGSRGSATASASWIRNRRSWQNTPYDKFVHTILDRFSGSNREEPARLVLQDPPHAPRTPWRTPRTCSWRCDSVATSATTIPSRSGSHDQYYQTAAYSRPHGA